jgi:hypothetical protein
VNALRRLLEVAVAPPCERGAPLLQRLVDGELAGAKSRAARHHVARCAPCRAHVRLLELEEQTVREIAAPTPRRFVELWSERLGEQMAAAVAAEAGERLLRHEQARARGEVDERADARMQAALDRYAEQVRQWLGLGPELGRGQSPAPSSATTSSSRSKVASPTRMRTT